MRAAVWGVSFLVLVVCSCQASVEELEQAVRSKDAREVDRAAQALAESGQSDELRALIKLLEDASDPQVYWALIRGAAAFQDDEALMELGRQVVRLKRESAAGDLVFALQHNQGSAVVRPLAHVLSKGPYPLKLMAASQLAFVRSPESVEALLAAWEREASKEGSELASRLQGALFTLTGETHASPDTARDWWVGQGEQLRAHEHTTTKPRDQEFGRTVVRGATERIVVLSSDRSELGGQDDYDNDFDKMQEILERRKIPHTVVYKHDFEKDPERYLKRCQALLINCNLITTYCVCPDCGSQKKAVQTGRLKNSCAGCDVHVTVNHRLTQPTLKVLKTWVERKGGYLYTEDWGIVEVLGLLWPGYVDSGTHKKTKEGIEDDPLLVRGTRNDRVLPTFTLGIRPKRGSTTHPLMRGVWLDPDRKGTAALTQHSWCVDDESPAIEVKNAKKVVVLMESEWLRRNMDGHAAVAVTFRPGSTTRLGKTRPGATGEWALARSGRVLHTMSHFGKQSDLEDGEALENLLLNFLLEAEARHAVNR